MMNSLLILWIVVATPILASDCDVAMDAFTQAGGDPLVARQRFSRCCNDKAISCMNGRVTEIHFSSISTASDSTAISTQLSGLDQLQVLLLDGNKLQGLIPPALGGLKNLQTLNLGNNQLTGPVPDTFGQLTSLTTLDLSHNLLNGSLSSLLLGMNNLQVLRLDDNHLSGPLPALKVSTTCDLHNNDALCLGGSSASLASSCGTLPSCSEKPIINFPPQQQSAACRFGTRKMLVGICLTFVSFFMIGSI